MTLHTINERGLIFLHIPKTAGTTLRTVLHRHYPHHVIFSFYEYPKDRHDFFALSEERRRELRVLQGHIPFGYHRFLSVPVDYITLLRNPVDLVISLYYWILRTHDPGLYHFVEGKSLSDFAGSGLALVRNQQTRMISGAINDCTNEDLQAAINNLNVHFTAFGLHARFDESLILFKRRLGWKSTFYARLNVTKGRPTRHETPLSTINLIEKNNALDMELYEFARKRFDEVVEEDSAFRDDLRAFQRLNKVYAGLELR